MGPGSPTQHTILQPRAQARARTHLGSPPAVGMKAMTSPVPGSSGRDDVVRPRSEEALNGRFTRWPRATALAALIAGLMAAGSTALPAKADGVTPAQLEQAGWKCIVPRINPSLLLCAPPGQGRRHSRGRPASPTGNRRMSSWCSRRARSSATTTCSGPTSTSRGSPLPATARRPVHLHPPERPLELHADLIEPGERLAHSLEATGQHRASVAANRSAK